MATVSSQAPNLTGLNATYSAASGGGDKFTPTKRTMLHIKNGGGVSVTATITTPKTYAGLAVGDAAVTVPAGEERLAGPFDPELFQASDGLASIAWSATASVTFAVLRI